MIIDSHVHLLGKGWLHPSLGWGGARIAAAAMSRKTGERPDLTTLAETGLAYLSDATAAKFVPIMDTAGIDKACVFSIDFGLVAGEPEVPIEEQNRLVAQAAEDFPGRLIPFFTIDPRRPGSVEMFSRAVEEWGMKGLKLHPTSGYFASDEICYPLYEKCMEYGVPALIHAGPINAPLKSRFAMPIYVDDVAADFPDLPIIIAHVGLGMWQEALHIASMKTNIFFDISAWQMFFAFYPEDFYRMLRRVVNTLGPWRVFFGSDTPMLDFQCPIQNWVKAVREPNLSSCPEVSFKQEEIEIIMGKAFAKLLKLDRDLVTQ
jgi:uncharacterized protein